MKSVFFAAMTAMLAFVAGSASAQEIVSNPRGIVPSVSLSDVAPVLEEMGAQVEIGSGENAGAMLVRYQGRVLIFRERACRSAGVCYGLQMVAKITASTDFNTVNQFNTGSPPTRAVLVGGDLFLDRYLIADFGITRGSLAVNVAVFTKGIDKWFEMTRATAVSFEDPARPAHEDFAYANMLLRTFEESNEPKKAASKNRRR